jgi:hypothetical protein
MSDIDKTREIIIETFNKSLDAIANENIIYGKSLNEWRDYLTVTIGDSENVEHLRGVMAEATDKAQECSNIIASLKIAIGKYRFEEFLNKNDARRIITEKKLSEAAYKRKETEAAFFPEGLTHITNMILDPFKEHKDKLHRTISVIHDLLMSLANERKMIDRS